jgi:putative restriction endonuclease
MNRSLRFFDYEQCYNHYVRSFESIRQKRINGETIVAKPVLMVALVDGIDANVFPNNQFVINDWLEGHYKMLMSQYAKDSQFDGTTEIDKPFWHLESDGFWHLNYQGERLSKSRTPSKAWLKENVEFAYFDEPLWILLQNKVWRMKLRDYIVERKLTNDHWLGRIAAEGLGALAVLLLAS